MAEAAAVVRDAMRVAVMEKLGNAARARCASIRREGESINLGRFDAGVQTPLLADADRDVIGAGMPMSCKC